MAGAYTLTAILDIAVNLEPTLLDNFPKLKTFYQTLFATAAFDGIRDYGMYLKRTA